MRPKPPSIDDLKWAAGYLDGHGSILFQGGHQSPRCMLSILFYRPEAPKLLLPILGNPTGDRKGSAKAPRKVTYTGANLIRVLALMIPHLRVKRELAVLTHAYTKYSLARNGVRSLGEMPSMMRSVVIYGRAFHTSNKHPSQLPLDRDESFTEVMAYCEAQLPKAPIERTRTDQYPIGGMWDDSEWEIQSNARVAVSGIIPCPHCHTPHQDEHGNNCIICPRVVVAKNEGGHNSTGVCVDCIIEAAPVSLHVQYIGDTLRVG